jgi:hypothetical protein
MIITGDKAKSWLSNVPDDKSFWCCNGEMLRNLKELSSALANMSQETYQYHVGRDGNDFSVWIRDVIGDVTLANQLQKSTSKAGAIRRVTERIGLLEQKI